MAFYNRVRLPFYVTQPQFTVDEEVYLKANGTRRVLRSIVNKEYAGKVDWVPAEIHERIAIAMRHDTVIVEGHKNTVGLRISSAYEIDWQEFLDHPLAPAKFKALEEAFVARNTRCGICPTVSMLTVVDDFIPTVKQDNTYLIDVTLNDGICCADPVLSILSYDTSIIDSISIAQTGIVTFTMKNGIVTTFNTVLFTYQAVCGDGSSGTGIVTANKVLGAGVPCEAPEYVEVFFSLEDLEATIMWPAASPAPTDGYQYELVRVEGGSEVLIATGTEAGLSAGTFSIEAGETYRAKVKSLCNGSCDTIVCISNWVMTEWTMPSSGRPGVDEYMTISVKLSSAVNGSDLDWSIEINIINPTGVTLDEDVTIDGEFEIVDSTHQVIPFSLVLLATTNTLTSSVLATSTDAGTAKIIHASPDPEQATGNDLIEYEIFLTI